MSRSPAKIFSKFNNRNFHLLERREHNLSIDSSDSQSLHQGISYLSNSYFTLSIESKTYNTVRRVVNRLIYLKLKRFIKKISHNLTLDVLRNISPKLYHFAKDKSTVLNLRLRLLGESWPPVIIYRATIKNLKTLTIEPFSTRKQFENVNNTWRVLFSDIPVILIKPFKPKDAKTRSFIPQNITPKHFSSRDSSNSYRFSRIGESITYSWKNQNEREYLRRPDVKYASPSSLPGYSNGKSVHSVIPTPSKIRNSWGVSFVKQYREDWQGLYFSEVTNMKNNSSILC